MSQIIIRDVSDRAKLSLSHLGPIFSSAVAVVFLSACAGAAAVPRPTYESKTGRLVRLDVDQNRDGFIEQRTYLDGNKPFRSEVDADANGRVERWEYVDLQGEVVKVGSSSRDDGIEDSWLFPLDPDGERLVERSSERTARVDRREFYRDSVLVRVEEDSNQDGLIDKWEHYEANTLRSLAFDLSRVGRPDRRLFFDAQGKFVRLETDDDGHGLFVVATPATAAAVRAAK